MMNLRLILQPFGRNRPLANLIMTLIVFAPCFYVGGRYLVTQRAVADVTAIRPYCELVTCRGGRCTNRQPIACSDVPATFEPYQSVRRSQQAHVEFIGRGGQSRSVWEDFSRFAKGHPRVGERIAIHYIDVFGFEPEVVRRPDLSMIVFGIVAFVFFLSIGARRRARWRLR